MNVTIALQSSVLCVGISLFDMYMLLLQIDNKQSGHSNEFEGGVPGQDVIGTERCSCVMYVGHRKLKEGI